LITKRNSLRLAGVHQATCVQPQVSLQRSCYRLHSIHSTAVVLDESFYVTDHILNFQLAVHSIVNMWVMTLLTFTEWTCQLSYQSTYKSDKSVTKILTKQTYNTAGRVRLISDLFDKLEAVNMVKVDNHLSSSDQKLNWL